MPQSLQFALQNHSNSSEVYIYITGLAIQHNSQRCFIQANGKELYFPNDVSKVGSPLEVDCAIPLGPPGNTVCVTVPQLAGARLWISMDSKLTFLLNPGPGLVEPSVLNPGDPNAKVNFGFCEFTLNDAQLYANITYVDFVPLIPIALSLKTASGALQHVAGMPPDGLTRIANALRTQTQQDGWPWDKLIVEQNGRLLRVLNPTHGGAVGANFNGYFEPYVEQVWQKYRQGANVKINTQAAPGILSGSVNRNGEFVVGSESFPKPTTADILSCNTGPFVTGPSPVRNAIIPRLAAGFVRTAILSNEEQPSSPDTFYRQNPTHHYSRIVHENNIDAKGYAFAYDDVQQDGGEDQSGKVNDGAPLLFTVTIGGHGAQASSWRPQEQFHQHLVNQQPVHQQPAYQQPSYQQPAYQQPSYQRPPYQQPSYEQPSYQQPAYQRPPIQQPPYQQPAYQQPAYQQPMYQQPTNHQQSPSSNDQNNRPGGRHEWLRTTIQRISQRILK